MISYLYICLQNNDLYIDFRDKYLNMYRNIIEKFPNNVKEYFVYILTNYNQSHLFNDIYYDKNENDSIPHLDLNEVFQISITYKNIINKFNIFENIKRDLIIFLYDEILNIILDLKQVNKLYYNNLIQLNLRNLDDLKKYHLEYEHNLFEENTIQVNESIINLENIQSNNLQSNILYISNLHKNLLDNIEDNNDKNIYINYEKLFEYEINYILEITIENFLRKEDKYFELIGDFNILDYYFTDSISYMLIIYIYYIYIGSKKKENKIYKANKTNLLKILNKVINNINDKYFNSFYSFILENDIYIDINFNNLIESYYNCIYNKNTNKINLVNWNDYDSDFLTNTYRFFKYKNYIEEYVIDNKTNLVYLKYEDKSLKDYIGYLQGIYIPYIKNNYNNNNDGYYCHNYIKNKYKMPNKIDNNVVNKINSKGKEYLEFYIKKYSDGTSNGLENFNINIMKFNVSNGNEKNNYTIPLEIKYFDTSKFIKLKLHGNKIYDINYDTQNGCALFCFPLDNIDTINIIYEEGYKYIIYFNKIIYDNDNTNYSFSLTDYYISKQFNNFNDIPKKRKIIFMMFLIIIFVKMKINMNVLKIIIIYILMNII